MQNEFFRVEVIGRSDALWQYILRPSGRTFPISPPAFEVDGKLRRATLLGIQPTSNPIVLSFGVTEYAFTGALAEDEDLEFMLVFRVAADSPVVRFKYRLASRSGRTLTRCTGHDRLDYLGLGLTGMPHVKEICFSEFRETAHSFCLSEVPLTIGDFENNLKVMGPMVVASGAGAAALVAYEHGSQVPDAFLQFRLTSERRVTLAAVKGNYFSGERFDQATPFESLWFQFAAVEGDEDRLASAYRRFVLHRMSSNSASRAPYIFYNTWAFQERNLWWNKRRYLDSMTQERILAEIDVAHRMGIDVFVLDTGWYEKTGDWRVNRARFPDGLKAVREKLNGFGMKLGLWFSPTEAAVTSRMLIEHKDCLMSRDGKESAPHGVWETEDSQCLCLVSRYWQAFADELIRLAKEVGVTYFKWDAVGQYGCDDVRHWHGGAGVTAQERADVYAFEQVRYMTRVVDRLCAACPEAIVDFDITEGGRSVGLAFLAAGKYFLINNGPYYHNYDIPCNSSTAWINIFVHPGPARGWICRTPLTFDKWIPSVLFLTHYLPDDPESSQLINIGSLILGQNGIWGDLLDVSAEGVARFGKWLGVYKQVRNDITRSVMVRVGSPGGSPEIYEKVDEETGRGVVVAFASNGGRFDYVTRQRVSADAVVTKGVEVTRDPKGRSIVRFDFDGAGARFVFFGAK